MNKSIQQRLRRAHNKLRQLCFAPMMRGSLVERVRKCGQPSCACATDPKRRHPGLFFTVNLDSKQQSIHVRPEDANKIRAAIEAYHRLWDVVNELTICEIEKLHGAVRNRRKNKT